MSASDSEIENVRAFIRAWGFVTCVLLTKLNTKEFDLLVEEARERVQAMPSEGREAMKAGLENGEALGHCFPDRLASSARKDALAADSVLDQLNQLWDLPPAHED
jgi:hypothetical protein